MIEKSITIEQRASEDRISKQTFKNRHRKLIKLQLDLENGCSKSEYNLLVSQSWIATGGESTSADARVYVTNCVGHARKYCK